MATKKYINLENLSTFLSNLRETFSLLGHNHNISDITDYKVDISLSSTSTNPVQNKVIDAEFEAVSQAMGALETVIDGKADASHTHIEVTNAIDTCKTYTDNVVGALEDSDTTYTLSKSGNTITLVGNDNSMTSVEESVTVASDDNAGNVVLESAAGISYLTESIKQEIVDAVLASLTTETLTFTLDDGTTVAKEVVVK